MPVCSPTLRVPASTSASRPMKALVPPPTILSLCPLSRAWSTCSFICWEISAMGGFRMLVRVLFVLKGAVFLAEPQGRNALARVQDTGGIKCGLYVVELLQLLVAELYGHLANLLHAHAMLTGNATTHFHTHFQNARAKGLGSLELARHVGIKQNQRVQVAIAGMEHIGDTQAKLLGHLLHFRQNVGDMTAGNGAVHAVVIRGNPADSWEGRFAAFPQQGTLLLTLGGANRCGAQLAKDFLGLGNMLVDFLLGTVHFTQQQGLGVPGVASLSEVIRRDNRMAIHH